MRVIGIDLGTKQNKLACAALNLSDPNSIILEQTATNSDEKSAVYQPSEGVYQDFIDRSLVYIIAGFITDQQSRGLDLVTYEMPPVMKNAKVALKLAHIGGAIAAICTLNNIPSTFVYPVQAKKALTGYGKSKKQAVMAMSKIVLGVQLSEDLADAVAIALAGEAKYREAQMLKMYG